MAGLNKVNPGEPRRISADAYNAFVDAAAANQSRQHDISVTPAFDKSASNNLVLLLNDSGEPRERFDVLGIDGPVITPENNLNEFLNRPVLSGVRPMEADHWGHFVILTQPVADQGLGTAWISGLCVARVNITSAAHNFADVDDGLFSQLKSDDSGAAQLLWKAPGLGVQWAVIRLGVPYVAPRSVWVLIREVVQDVSWVWVERVKPSDDYATNGGLYVPLGPPGPLPERMFDEQGEPVHSDAYFANLLKGWQQMAVDPHRISQDYDKAVWVGPIVDREPCVFPAEKIGGNWHVAPRWRTDVVELPPDTQLGDCKVGS